MAANAWKAYNSFRKNMADGLIDLDGHTFKIALFQSSSNCGDVAQTGYASLTNEVANGNGYVTGGATLGSVTFNYSGTTATFDCADPTWTASGGSIVSRFAVIYDDTATGDPLVACSLLDNAPANITENDGQTLTLQINASGIFTITGMA